MIRDLEELVSPGLWGELDVLMAGSGYGPTDIRRMFNKGMTIEEVKNVLKNGQSSRMESAGAGSQASAE